MTITKGKDSNYSIKTKSTHNNHNNRSRTPNRMTNSKNNPDIIIPVSPLLSEYSRNKSPIQQTLITTLNERQNIEKISEQLTGFKAYELKRQRRNNNKTKDDNHRENDLNGQTITSANSHPPNTTKDNFFARQIAKENERLEKRRQLVLKKEEQKRESIPNSPFRINKTQKKDSYYDRQILQEQERVLKRMRLAENKKRREQANKPVLNYQPIIKTNINRKDLNGINALFQWDENKKLKNQMKIDEEKMRQFRLKLKECSFTPMLSKNTQIIAQKQRRNLSTENTFDRLYSESKQRNEQKELTSSFYQPSFKPTIYSKNLNTSFFDCNDNSFYDSTITIENYRDYSSNNRIMKLYREKVNNTRKRYQSLETDL